MGRGQKTLLIHNMKKPEKNPCTDIGKGQPLDL